MERPLGGEGEGPGAVQQTDPDGHIPFAIRVGVTGHRDIRDSPELSAAVGDALARIAALAPGAAGVPPILVVVSSLAEGADRLIAAAVLAGVRNRLEVALPLAPDDYADDFSDQASRREFRELLVRACELWQAPPGESRDVAYERAGHHVVDRCDVLIALWDGEPSRGRGGTAEIVAYARRRARPLVWIRPSAPPVVSDELGKPSTTVLTDAALELRRYNATWVARERIRAHVAAEWNRLGLGSRPGSAAGLDAVAVVGEQTALHLLPSFARADLLALTYQRYFQRLSTAMFVAAAAAVFVVALQTNFFSLDKWVLSFELALLALLLVLPWVSRRSRLHERWISYRFLAERLRSAYFLAIAGTGDRGRRHPRPVYLANSADLWIARALEEATAGLARISLRPADVRSVREYLGRVWIAGQIDYHVKASRLHQRRDSQLVAATAWLFGLTFVATLLHVVGVGPAWLESLLILVSVSVPVAGAAVHGLGTLRQFRRNADRYTRMTALLRRLQQDMERARSLETVRRLAADAERVMREESADWFGVMRFFDVELIT